MNGRQVTVSTDRYKPVYIMMETDDRSVITWAHPEEITHPESEPSPPAIADHPFRPTRPLPGPVKLLSTILREGMMWGQISLSAAIFRAQLGTHTNIRKRPYLGPHSTPSRIQADQSQDSLF